MERSGARTRNSSTQNDMTEKQIALFWSKVSKTETCWLWTASVGWNGYGMFGKPTRRAHLVAIELAGIAVLPGMLGLHKCNNTRCVRYHPDHVYVGTHSDNASDRWKAGVPDNFRESVSLVTRGEDNGAHKLTEEQVIEIRNLYENGRTGRARSSSMSMQKLANRFGMSYTQVKRIIHKQAWRHV